MTGLPPKLPTSNSLEPYIKSVFNRLRNYELMKKAYERGMAEQRAREAANGGLDPWFKHV